MFHLRRTCDVAGTYRETLWRHRHDVLLPGGEIRDEKLQCDTNREAAKISAWSSGKIDKYEYLTGEEKLPSDKVE